MSTDVLCFPADPDQYPLTCAAQGVVEFGEVPWSRMTPDEARALAVELTNALNAAADAADAQIREEPDLCRAMHDYLFGATDAPGT